MNLNVDALMDVLPKAVSGWASVFVVIVAIVAVVAVMNKITK